MSPSFSPFLPFLLAFSNCDYPEVESEYKAGKAGVLSGELGQAVALPAGMDLPEDGRAGYLR